MDIVADSLIILTGLAQGMAVGIAFASFITILDVVYRLLQVSDTSNYLRIYEKSLIISFSLFGFLDLIEYRLRLGSLTIIFTGLMMGIFIGLLASALAEVLNVIPIIVNRLNTQKYIQYILISIIAGKVFGSLIYWLKIN
ncbi:MAG: stage sporulation protein [Candidatus Petromonas sp.]|jgi:stage V sporulation protein AB|nr:stage sporulation protein [Candidatus Petromonas sp.]